jgi:hypothetical protein
MGLRFSCSNSAVPLARTNRTWFLPFTRGSKPNPHNSAVPTSLGPRTTVGHVKMFRGLRRYNISEMMVYLERVLTILKRGLVAQMGSPLFQMVLQMCDRVRDPTAGLRHPPRSLRCGFVGDQGAPPVEHRGDIRHHCTRALLRRVRLLTGGSDRRRVVGPVHWAATGYDFGIIES